MVSTKESGFPTGDGTGRIGLAVFDDNVVYAVHDSQFRREKKKKDEKDGLTKEDFKTMDNTAFLALEDKKLNEFLKTNGFQEKYRAENVKQMVRSGSVKPIDLAKYLENANSLLFDTPVIGAEVYRSEDAGATWTKMNEDYIDYLLQLWLLLSSNSNQSQKQRPHLFGWCSFDKIGRWGEHLYIHKQRKCAL